LLSGVSLLCSLLFLCCLLFVVFVSKVLSFQRSLCLFSVSFFVVFPFSWRLWCCCLNVVDRQRRGVFMVDPGED
jgi:hypothetical protein